MKKRKWIKRLLWGLMFLAIAVVVVNTLRIYQYSSEFFDAPADVAIVLGAGTANGEVSPVFRERINHGIDLYQTGKVKALIFTGGVGRGQSISDSQVAQNYAVGKGVPESAIFIEEESTVTYENLKHAKVILEEQHFDTVLLVSDPLHMKRSMRHCNKLKISAQPSPTPTTMYRTWKSKSRSLVYESFYYNLDLVAEPLRRK